MTTRVETLDFDTCEDYGLDGTLRTGLAARGVGDQPCVKVTLDDGTEIVGVVVARPLFTATVEEGNR